MNRFVFGKWVSGGMINDKDFVMESLSQDMAMKHIPEWMKWDFDIVVSALNHGGNGFSISHFDKRFTSSVGNCETCLAAKA